MRIACAVEYDGDGFRGWQIQRAARTVQGAVEHALGRVADEPLRTICAGRTDAGVHAIGQVVHFDTGAQRPDRAWVLGTNAHLPPDVAVRWARCVDANFHARFSTVDRAYRYLILEREGRPALARARCAWSRQVLDVPAMRRAAAHLLGEHDFSAFRAAGCQARHPVRTVHAIGISRRGDRVAIDVRANAFLHNMVRIIAGTLMAVGRGDRAAARVREILAGRDRRRAAETAPSRGLYFVGPSYPQRYQLPPRPDAMPPVA